MVHIDPLTSPALTHGVCLNCNDEFHLEEPHVSVLDFVFCDVHCLAEYTEEYDLDVDAVEDAYVEHERGEGLPVQSDMESIEIE